ncbi:M15 family metallopeptidase [Arthrobacter agilis]|uniref:M15 family metallopeptidase n=1 Tax=Arthrobacter agilis TaxID=37921 RepID=UPI002783E947|nr:M15 family metallopeptidase [Arthrobacter agilis]MDQ0735754.1 D-alanyl-D-alanine carboxypeptidase [Arthrobacter agilis]
MRRRGLAAMLLIALALPACSGPDPAATVSSPDATEPSGPAATGGAPTSGPPTGEPTPTGDASPGALPAPVQRDPSPTATASPTTTPPATAVPAAVGHTDPGAVDVVVNKRRPLVPLDFAPADLRQPGVATATENALLRPDVAAAVEQMFTAAGDDGVGLVLVSGYRSFATQESTYASWVAQYGDAAGADTVSARPGYSEHQTGLAFDIGQADGACTLVLCFRDTPAGQWAAAHAADFGFILRYPLGFHEITGFSAESWHFRYVGRDVSLAMKAAGTQTLEEHFGLPAAPSY